MSWGYMFFAPTRLPLTPAALSEETVHSFTDAAKVQATLSAHLPRLAWTPDPEGCLARGTVSEDDADYEFSIRSYDGTAGSGAPSSSSEARQLIVKLRCSGRIDSAPFAQRLCDATGWIAFDDRVDLFQPHHPPVFAGGG